MAKADYWQRGETLDYTNETGVVIEAGTIVEMAGRIGVAGEDIQPGSTGSIHVSGVFRFKKGSTNEIPMGTAVYFENDEITEVEGGTAAGYAAEKSDASSKEILVKIG